MQMFPSVILRPMPNDRRECNRRTGSKMADYVLLQSAYEFRWPDGQIKKTCPAPSKKIFRLCRRANQRFDSARLTREEGRVAIVTKRGLRCGGRGSAGAQGNRRAGVSRERYPSRMTAAPKRTAKSCGPDTRCWCQVGGGDVSPT